MQWIAQQATMKEFQQVPFIYPETLAVSAFVDSLNDNARSMSLDRFLAARIERGKIQFEPDSDGDIFRLNENLLLRVMHLTVTDVIVATKSAPNAALDG